MSISVKELIGKVGKIDGTLSEAGQGVIPFATSIDPSDLMKPAQIGDSKPLQGIVESFGFTPLQEGTSFLGRWIRYRRIPAQILKIDVDTVTVIFLIVKNDKKTYKERRLSKELFEGVNLKEGNRLLFNYYKRHKAFKVEIFDDQRLIPESDFPEVDTERLSKLEFLQKKK